MLHRTPLTVGLVLTALCLAPASGQTQPQGPWGGGYQPTFPVFDDVLNAYNATGADSALLDSLSDGYIDVARRFTTLDITQTQDNVFMDSFAVPYEPGTHGLMAIGAPGPVDPSTYGFVIGLPLGMITSIQNLELWPVDMSSLVLPPGDPSILDVEGYCYSAQIGSSTPHVGLAIRVMKASRSELGLYPMAEVPDGGPIDSSDAGAYLGMLASSGFDTVSFSDWALSRYQGSNALVADIRFERPWPPSKPSDSSDCDGAAMNACLSLAAATATDQLADESQRHKDAVDAIHKSFGTDKTAMLGAGLTTVVVQGVLAWVTAGTSVIVQIGIGAIAVGSGWLTGTAINASAGDQCTPRRA